MRSERERESESESESKRESERESESEIERECESEGWFTIRGKVCVRCTVYIVTQRNVSMASSEINAKNATQRYSVAQLNRDSPQ